MKYYVLISKTRYYAESGEREIEIEIEKISTKKIDIPDYKDFGYGGCEYELLEYESKNDKYRLMALNEDEYYVGRSVIINLEPEQVSILNMFFSNCNCRGPIKELRIEDVIQ